MFNFTWNYLIITYIKYDHTYIMQISIYAINNIPEPGRNLAADACMGRTQLSPCIISVLGQSLPTGMPGQECHVSMTFFSCWATYIQILFGNIYNIVTTNVTNSTDVEPVSYIISLNQLAVKITRPSLSFGCICINSSTCLMLSIMPVRNLKGYAKVIHTNMPFALLSLHKTKHNKTVCIF